MVIQNQLFSYTHPPHQNVAHPISSSLFPLSHYHQDSLMYNNHQVLNLKKTPIPNHSTKSSFYIDDLLRINEETHKKHYQSTHINSPSTSVSSSSSSSSPSSSSSLNSPSSTSSSSSSSSLYSSSSSSSSTSSSSSCKKSKRIRTIFTQHQLEILEDIFTHTQYMVGGQRAALSDSLGLSDTQVKVWFQNRRIKLRKSSTNRNSKPQQNCNSPSTETKFKSN